VIGERARSLAFAMDWYVLNYCRSR